MNVLLLMSSKPLHIVQIKQSVQNVQTINSVALRCYAKDNAVPAMRNNVKRKLRIYMVDQYDVVSMVNCSVKNLDSILMCITF